MIIGKDSFNKNFGANYNPVSQNNQSNNKMNQNLNTEVMRTRNVLDKKDMNDKAYAMLEDRLNKGLISLDEFTKKCRQLNKK